MVDPIETIDWPLPSPEPCDEGLIRYPILVCNGMGKWVPDYTAPAESGGGASIRAIGATLKPHGCGGDPVALVRLGAELFKAGMDYAKSK